MLLRDQIEELRRAIEQAIEFILDPELKKYQRNYAHTARGKLKELEDALKDEEGVDDLIIALAQLRAELPFVTTPQSGGPKELKQVFSLFQTALSKHLRGREDLITSVTANPLYLKFYNTIQPLKGRIVRDSTLHEKSNIPHPLFLTWLRFFAGRGTLQLTPSGDVTIQSDMPPPSGILAVPPEIRERVEQAPTLRLKILIALQALPDPTINDISTFTREGQDKVRMLITRMYSEGLIDKDISQHPARLRLNISVKDIEELERAAKYEAADAEGRSGIPMPVDAPKCYAREYDSASEKCQACKHRDACRFLT